MYLSQNVRSERGIVIIGIGRENSDIDTRWNDGELAIVIDIDRARIERMRVLLAALLIGRGHDAKGTGHCQPLSGNTPGKVEPRLHLRCIGLGHAKLVDFLRTERVARECKRHARCLLEQRCAITTISIMCRRSVWKIGSIECDRVVDEFR